MSCIVNFVTTWPFLWHHQVTIQCSMPMREAISSCFPPIQPLFKIVNLHCSEWWHSFCKYKFQNLSQQKHPPTSKICNLAHCTHYLAGHSQCLGQVNLLWDSMESKPLHCPQWKVTSPGGSFFLLLNFLSLKQINLEVQNILKDFKISVLARLLVFKRFMSSCCHFPCFYHFKLCTHYQHVNFILQIMLPISKKIVWLRPELWSQACLFRKAKKLSKTLLRY